MATTTNFNPKDVLISFILVVALYVVFCLFGTVAPVKATTNTDILAPHSTSSLIVWPTQGQSAVGVVGTNILDTHGPQSPVPTASTAKMITALMVLKAKPLSAGQQGPSITLTSNDVNIFNSYVAQDGSVVPVKAGEQMSEYQMLEAMLLPSANNIADSLAIWSYGSLSSYSAAANSYLQGQGLSQTHVGPDASGFNPATTSTAHDLVKIGELVMDEPVLAQIVGQPSASGIPIVGNVKNVNYLLGSNNIVGIKTGNNDQDKGAFVGAGQSSVNGRTETVVTANLGSSSLGEAVSGSLLFLKSAENNFIPITLIPAGAEIATYKMPWTDLSIPAHSSSNLIAYAWGGTGAHVVTPVLDKVTTSDKSGHSLGSVTGTGYGVISSTATNAVLGADVPKASLTWKLTHPEELRP